MNTEPSLFRTIGNEIIIGYIKEENGVDFVLSKTATVGMDQEGRMILVPYCPFSKEDNEIHLKKTAICHGPEVPGQSIVDYYKSLTSPIIQKPASGKIIL